MKSLINNEITLMIQMEVMYMNELGQSRNTSSREVFLLFLTELFPELFLTVVFILYQIINLIIFTFFILHNPNIILMLTYYYKFINNTVPLFI